MAKSLLSKVAHLTRQQLSGFIAVLAVLILLIAAAWPQLYGVYNVTIGQWVASSNDRQARLEASTQSATTGLSLLGAKVDGLSNQVAQVADSQRDISKRIDGLYVALGVRRQLQATSYGPEQPEYAEKP